jgi:hypothetical protein
MSTSIMSHNCREALYKFLAFLFFCSFMCLAFFPIVVTVLLTSCNEVAIGNVTGVVRTQPFQCRVGVSVEGRDGVPWAGTMEGVDCYLVRSCHQTLGKFDHQTLGKFDHETLGKFDHETLGKFDQNAEDARCQGVTVAYNHIYRERSSCLTVVFSKNDQPLSTYFGQMGCLLAILFCWTTLVVSTLVVRHYSIRVFD